MSAYQVHILTFEQRIEKFSKQVQEETDGEYSIVPCPCGYVELQYKGAGLIKVLAAGKTYKQLYGVILALVKAFSNYELADLGIV